jgi:hypothetical protein
MAVKNGTVNGTLNWEQAGSFDIIEEPDGSKALQVA